ncbi:MAG: ribosome biogenesis GTPase YlqF [Peptococcaceae bacterium]|jgi:ribosome biogenesis GTPase A|nr:ribosome biogenesis GTPase YlqF [Peptococcaceae bacterium]
MNQIQWFPGHMAKTKRLLIEQLKWVDVVVELVDARVPLSSQNPLLQELLENKARLMLLNKADLADPQWTEQWLQALRRKHPALAVSVATGAGMGRLIPLLEELAADKLAALQAKGMRVRPIRVMAAGIPNIGKSSLINRLTGGGQAKTGNKPGVTRGKQWIRIHEKLELMDTPGILWPKFEDPEVGKRLAVTGAIRDEVFDIEELAAWLLVWLQTREPQLLAERQIREDGDMLEAFGRRRGCLLRGGRIDTLKAAQILLKEFRQGNVGRVTLDRF